MNIERECFITGVKQIHPLPWGSHLPVCILCKLIRFFISVLRCLCFLIVYFSNVLFVLFAFCCFSLYLASDWFSLEYCCYRAPFKHKITEKCELMWGELVLVVTETEGECGDKGCVPFGDGAWRDDGNGRGPPSTELTLPPTCRLQSEFWFSDSL